MKHGLDFTNGAELLALCEEHGVHVQTYDDKHVLAKKNHPYMERYCREIVCEARIDENLPFSLKEEPSKLLLLSYDDLDLLAEILCNLSVFGPVILLQQFVIEQTGKIIFVDRKCFFILFLQILCYVGREKGLYLSKILIL